MGPELTWPRVIAAGFALAGAAATATWLIRADRVEELKERILVCEKASELRYPDLVQNLNSASEKLTVQLNNMEDLEALKAERDSLVEQLKVQESDRNQAERKMKMTSDSLQQELKIAQGKLDEVYSTNQQFKIEQGQAKELAGGSIVVGFSEATYKGTCIVRVNNNRHDWAPGNFGEYKSQGRECKIILTDCQYGSSHPAEFRFICAE